MNCWYENSKTHSNQEALSVQKRLLNDSTTCPHPTIPRGRPYFGNNATTCKPNMLKLCKLIESTDFEGENNALSEKGNPQLALDKKQRTLERDGD